MEINRPDILAEVTELFEIYERALVTNDVATLDGLFWESPLVVRYGNGENLYGIDALRAFRAARPRNDSRDAGCRTATIGGAGGCGVIPSTLGACIFDDRGARCGSRGR